jgi:hypothetical protein
MRSMSWVFTAVMKRARDFDRERVRRLNEAYARCWYKKYRERKQREREQRKPREG